MLADWQRENRLTNADAARLLGLSVSAYCRQKSGRSRVSRQTKLLCNYVEIVNTNWLNIAEIATNLARVCEPVTGAPRLGRDPRV